MVKFGRSVRPSGCLFSAVRFFLFGRLDLAVWIWPSGPDPSQRYIKHCAIVAQCCAKAKVLDLCQGLLGMSKLLLLTQSVRIIFKFLSHMVGKEELKVKPLFILWTLFEFAKV